MQIRKTTAFYEEIHSEYGTAVDPPLRRIAVGVVFHNPLAGEAPGANLQPLVDLSNGFGESLTQRALAFLGEGKLRSYTKGAIVGTAGDLEHGAAMIHPRLGMAMRRAIRRGTVIIPGHAKVGPPGAPLDLLYGPIDSGWDLDAVDSMQVAVPDAPRPNEIVLFIGYGSGPRPNARCKGPDQKEVDVLVRSFQQSPV